MKIPYDFVHMTQHENQFTLIYQSGGITETQYPIASLVQHLRVKDNKFPL